MSKHAATANDPQWLEFARRAEQDQALAQRVAAALRAGLDARGEAALAVSGGRTPAGFFRHLSLQQLNWSRVAITLVDERWLPPDHPDSNERMLRTQLLRRTAAAAHFTGLKTAHDNARSAENSCEQALAKLPWPLDAVHLGVGGDGHTASWFADAPEYARALDTNAPARVLACHPQSAPYARMSLSLRAVLDSRLILLQLTGSDKRAVLEAALAGDRSLPVTAVLQQRRVPVAIYWAP